MSTNSESINLYSRPPTSKHGPQTSNRIRILYGKRLKVFERSREASQRVESNTHVLNKKWIPRPRHQFACLRERRKGAKKGWATARRGKWAGTMGSGGTAQSWSSEPNSAKAEICPFVSTICECMNWHGRKTVQTKSRNSLERQ